MSNVQEIVTGTPDLQARLMQVRLKISQWYPRKYDREASEEIARMHNAGSDADEVGRYNKILVSLRSIKPVQKRISQLRKKHYEMTSAWVDEGVRVLPTSMYFQYLDMLREARDEVGALVRDFVLGEYDRQRSAARVRLGSLFRDDDYPEPDEVLRRFSVLARVEPLANPDDVRVWGFSKNESDAIMQDVRQSQLDAIEEAHKDVIDRVRKRAQHFIDAVQKYDDNEGEKHNSLYSSAVDNLRDVVQIVLGGLNIKGDQYFRALAQSIDDALADLNADQLKHSHDLRETKIAEMRTQLAKLDGIYGESN